MTQPEIIPSKDVPLPGLTPQEVLRRLKKDMPQDAPIKEGGKVVGYEETGIGAALDHFFLTAHEHLRQAHPGSQVRGGYGHIRGRRARLLRDSDPGLDSDERSRRYYV